MLIFLILLITMSCSCSGSVFGLGTKTTWFQLEKYHELALNICFLSLQTCLKMSIVSLKTPSFISTNTPRNCPKFSYKSTGYWCRVCKCENAVFPSSKLSSRFTLTKHRFKLQSQVCLPCCM